MARFCGDGGEFKFFKLEKERKKREKGGIL
jgi:hypothetical protein